MLKIDRSAVGLQRLTVKTLSEAKILERSDLQKMIVTSPEAFFQEMEENLVLVGQEVEPSDLVGDRIDLLALDQDGNAVIIELKRAEQKLQLLQALSYAAMLSEWSVDDLVAVRSTFAQETDDDARESMSDHVGKSSLEGANSAQRIVLIAEGFDFALLKTAEWLTEKYGVDIRCYRIEYSADGPSEYLSCVCVYPPPEIADHASRVRKPSAANPNKPVSWDQVLATVKSQEVLAFFKKELAKGTESRLTSKQLFYRLDGIRRLHVAVRRQHAWVYQHGRFDDDEAFWSGRLSTGRVKAHEGALTFELRTADDFKLFEQAADALAKVEFHDGPEEDSQE